MTIDTLNLGTLRKIPFQNHSVHQEPETPILASNQ